MAERPPRWGRGALYGAGAAVGAVAAWVLLAYVTESQLTYLAVGLGIVVAICVGNGVGRGGRRPAALSVGLTVVGLAIGLYYTQRIAFIRERQPGLRYQPIPLLPSWAWFRTVIRGAFDRGITMYLTIGVALVAAGGYGYRGPVVRRRYVGQRHLPRRPR